MREPPDQLTAHVWQMLAAARTSPLTHAEVIEELTLSLRWDVAYLARRANKGRQTAYDEVLGRSLAARARAVVLLEQLAVMTSGPIQHTVFACGCRRQAHQGYPGAPVAGDSAQEGRLDGEVGGGAGIGITAVILRVFDVIGGEVLADPKPGTTPDKVILVGS